MLGGAAIAACSAPPSRLAPSPVTSAVPSSAPVASAAAAPAVDLGPVIRAPHPAADLFAGLPEGEAQRRRLCARGHTDAISQLFCGDEAPAIESLVDLQRALGIAFDNPGLPQRENVTGNAREGNPAFVFLGHTTSLTARIVSPISPRVIVFKPPVHTGRSGGYTVAKFQADPEFRALAFTRGEQIVELVDRDPASGDLRFFVVRFEQACNENEEGCSSWQLFGPAVERDWKRVTIYDDTDLENTPADCNVCHQPDGHGTKRKLLMQALRTPWTHFFRQNREGGKWLIHQYQQAHDTEETFAGIPGTDIFTSDPALLEGLVENEGFIEQPVPLHANAIEAEIDAKDHQDQPVLALAWQIVFKKALTGEIPGVGYPVVDFVDADRMRRAARAYQAVMGGLADAGRAPYMGDMHRDEVSFRVGLGPKPGQDGRGIMRNVCRRCHNPSRNPALTRARFEVDRLDQLPAHELEKAKQRLRLPIDSPHRMPPARFGVLSDEQIARVEAELDAQLAQRRR